MYTLVKNSDIIIGGKRNIESILALVENKEIYYVDKYLDKLIKYIEKNNEKKISVVVSGDSGFYSLLTYIKNNYKGELEVVSGISSMQYMFSKICETWDDAFISSVHGRYLDFSNHLGTYKKIGLLTDNKYTPQKYYLLQIVLYFLPSVELNLYKSLLMILFVYKYLQNF